MPFSFQVVKFTLSENITSHIVQRPTDIHLGKNTSWKQRQRHYQGRTFYTLNKKFIDSRYRMTQRYLTMNIIDVIDRQSWLCNSQISSAVKALHFSSDKLSLSIYGQYILYMTKNGSCVPAGAGQKVNKCK